MLKKILLTCLFFTTVYSQTKEISYLPVQNSSQAIKESIPIYLSDSHYLIFYMSPKLDTLYLARTVDAGTNWQKPLLVKTIALPPTQKSIFLSSLKTKSGRILIAWQNSYEGMNIIHSDDNGFSWSNSFLIASGIGSPKKTNNLNLSQLNDNRVLLTFNHDTVTTALYYKESFDNGSTFTDVIRKIDSFSGLQVSDCTIIPAENNNLRCLFKLRSGINSPYKIYMKKSSDNGISWGDIIEVISAPLNKTEFTVTKDKNGKFSLIYVQEDTVKFYDPYYSSFIQKYVVGDVYYSQSTDFGDSWSIEKRLTRYAGDDKFVGSSTNNGKNLITYSSVKFTGDYQILYTILDEANESFHPPCLFFSYFKKIYPGPIKFLLRVFVKDDEGLSKVTIALINSDVTAELFDDGSHEDGIANDGVFSNEVDIWTIILQSRFILNVNKITMPFLNDGSIADMPSFYHVKIVFDVSDKFQNHALIDRNVSLSTYNIGSGGVFDNNVFLFAGGFIMSGLKNNQLWVNGVVPVALVNDYMPGTVGSISSDYKFRFYVVKKDDTPFGTSWMEWRDAVNLGAEFYDGDGDGFYNPKDKNYNGIWDKNEDMPALIGDITAWCIYNDGLPTFYRRWESEILGIEVRQTVFASSNPELKNVIFIKYNLLNTGLKSDILDSVYFGFWADPDIGNPARNFVGSDTLLHSYFAFSQPEIDTSRFYGVNPPSFYTTLLQGPVMHTNNQNDSAKLNYGEIRGSKRIPGARNLDISSFVMFKGADPNLGDPNSAIEVRNFMLGLTKDGKTVNPCTFVYGTVRGGVDCSQVNPKLWFSGDPVTQVGWLSTIPGDIRALLNTGPFVLEKNKPTEIIMAYVVGRGSDNMNSITVAREFVKRTLTEYNNNFSSITYKSGFPLYPVAEYKLYQNYPNPFNARTIIRYEYPQDGIVTIEVYDILGQKVKTLLNEYRIADRYEVEFDANGLSSGLYFYTVRVNDFTQTKKMLLLR